MWKIVFLLIVNIANSAYAGTHGPKRATHNNGSTHEFHVEDLPGAGHMMWECDKLMDCHLLWNKLQKTNKEIFEKGSKVWFQRYNQKIIINR